MKRKFVRTNEALYIILLRHYGKQLWKGISWESQQNVDSFKKQKKIYNKLYSKEKNKFYFKIKIN